MTVSAPLDFGVLAFSSLFAMVNPISAAPIFVELTRGQERARRRTAWRASLTALTALILFATAGGAIFSFFGITVPAFQIVGGLLFSISSIRALQGLREGGDEHVEEGADPSVVPIGIPLIAGAGAISTVMVLAGQAPGRMHQVALAAAILANIALTLMILLAAPSVVARISPSAQNVISKIMGLLTAVIGVQFIINGGTAVIVELMRHARG
ncbi:MAG: MarC family protein [Fimbriimonas ginsengisoli]|uniref:UPF0056 membrane protein n=1 Tax=Fimbriimonas ginsengisoli TaxID=1005039 RepID=A0A931PV65_FIMGI|nr:MarC family protein [Fimbriimonas ginsengisoli]